MTIKLKMTDDQIETAEKLRHDGMSWAKISRKLDLHWQTIRDTLYPDYAEHRKDMKRKRMAAVRNGAPLVVRNKVHVETHRVIHCPDDIMIERDRRLAIPYADFTSEWFGDPRPGFSQLDKKRAQGLWK